MRYTVRAHLNLLRVTTSLKTSEGQEIVENGMQSLRMFSDNRHELTQHFGLMHRALEESFRETLDRRYRRSQLMRYIRHEISPHILQFMHPRHISNDDQRP